jgi:predicted histone-like DNA-binding protein
MSINFKPVKRPTPGIKNTGKGLWYPTICDREKIDLNRILDDLKTRHNIHRATTIHVLKALEYYVAEKLKEGHSIHLGTFGIIYPTLEGTPSETAEKVSSKNIRKVNIRFRAGKTLREALHTASFRKVKE